MKIIEAGHIYELNWLDGEPRILSDGKLHAEYHPENRLIFVNREDTPHGGTQTQEVIRALIDRTQHCDRCLRWEGNDLIVQHLRMALVLHEARALERKTLKGRIAPEKILTGLDGHFKLYDE
jgi:hypothetical protein